MYLRKNYDFWVPKIILIIYSINYEFESNNKKLIRKTEKTYGWDLNGAGKVLNKKLTVVIFT